MKKQIEPKTITRKQLKEYVPYSDTHLRRLEAAGKFPKRIKIGAHRVVWMKDEIVKWLEEKIDRDRDVKTSATVFESLLTTLSNSINERRL